MKSTLSFYGALFLRRIHIFLIIFLLAAAVSITLARILPPVYLAQARLLVESSQIPNQLAAPTVQTGAAQELQIIQQRLMTRVNLLDIARSENVFENINDMTADEIVKKMRDATQIRRTAGRNQATFMTVAFSADKGAIAARVVNQYVTLILQNSTAIRTERAGNTLEFFQGEVDRLGKKLQGQSDKILKFKNANVDALPTTLNYRLNQQTVLQGQLSSVDRQLSVLQEQRRRVVEIYNATGNVVGATNNLTPEEKTLVQLKDSLTKALAVYSPENPKVKLIEAQIVQQEAVVASRSTAVVSNPNSSTTVLDVNLAGIDAQIDLLTSQKDQVTTQLASLKDTIDRTPANAIKLSALDRDYQNTQQQYNGAVRSLSQASMGERIELLSKGQRIAILDPATVPSEPDSPNRILIGAGGSAFGAFLGLALIGLLEFLNNSIRRPTDIIKQLGITPIATVPYVRTPMELVMRRAGFVLFFAFIIIGVPAALYAVNTFYMPLDLIYDRVAATIREYI
jgi:uncharacterized protein involved in exopolysaccharide biosynthesis